MRLKPLIGIIVIILIYLSVAEPVPNSLQINNKTTYYATEIMDQIEEGQDVFCDEAVIIGDLRLNGLNISSQKTSGNVARLVNSSINIINSEIKGDVDFGNTDFTGPLKLEGTIFSGQEVNFMKSLFNNYTSFSGSTFQCPVHFDGAKIDRDIYFTGSDWLEKASFENFSCDGYASFRDNDFQKGLNFKYVNMTGPASFEDSRLHGETSFSNSIFEEEVVFLGATFNDLVEITGAKFNGSAIFSRTRFQEIADFSNTQFGSNTTFFNAKFANAAKFSQSEFDGRTDFRKCEFDGFADFSSTGFFGSARFDEAQFNKAARFTNSNFTESVSFIEVYFEKEAYFEGARFGEILNLTNITFSELLLPWNAISENIEYDNATKMALINNYKNLNWRKDYENSYYDYRDKKRISEPYGSAKLADTLSWIYWGYGTNTYMPIIYIILSTFFFACIYYGLVQLGLAKVVKKFDKSSCVHCIWAKIEEQDARGLSLKEAIIFSAKNLLTMERPDDFEIKHKHIGKIIWIENAIFGFLAAIFVYYLLDVVRAYFKPL